MARLTRVRVIAAIFRKAIESQPAYIVIDEADHLFARRSASQRKGVRSIRYHLLVAMSRVIKDVNKRVMFITTTYSPEYFDDAFIRRFSYYVYVELPDEFSRLPPHCDRSHPTVILLPTPTSHRFLTLFASLTS